MTPLGDGGTTSLSPDEAFAAVGNETRVEILRTLGKSETLSFSELYDRVGMTIPATSPTTSTSSPVRA